jgi:hypothetical protein
MKIRYYKTLEELRNTEGVRVDVVENITGSIAVFYNQYPKCVCLSKEVLGKEYDNKFSEINSSQDHVFCLDLVTKLI